MSNRWHQAAVAGAGISAIGLFLAAAFGWPFWGAILLLLVCLFCLGLAAAGGTRQREAGAEGLLAAIEGRGAVPGDSLDAGTVRLREAIQRLRSTTEESSSRADRMEATLDALQEPVIAVGPDGRTLAANAAAGKLLGLAAARLRGRAVEELFTQADIAGLYREAAQGRAGRAEVRVPRPEGFRVWAIAATPMGAAAGGAGGDAAAAVVLEIRDITENARALQVRTDFVANASHELRTPIAAMRVAADTLQAVQDEDPAMRRRLIGVVSSNVARLEEMARDLLDLSRLETPETGASLEPTSLAALAGELAELFQKACRERGLTLEFELDPDLEGMRTDRTLLHLILSNLIDNATKYAREGTTIRVRARVVDGPGGGAARGDGPERVARLEVIDQGMGIPLDQQQRVFERYYQVEAARSGSSLVGRRGTGLGLSIVKHAVKRLGGTIRAESVWGEGTTMIVELPARRGSAGC
jgi:two-component system phosphate regulon sensor histidine kinase PhoR